MTTTCFYLVYALSTICYQQQPVPAIQPIRPAITAPLASLNASPNVWGQQPVTPTWQDIIRQQNDSDGSDE
jgi:hypothetical protein